MDIIKYNNVMSHKSHNNVNKNLIEKFEGKKIKDHNNEKDIKSKQIILDKINKEKSNLLKEQSPISIISSKVDDTSKESNTSENIENIFIKEIKENNKNKENKENLTNKDG